MSDPQQLHVDQGAKFVLPYGCVVAMSGSGVFLHRSDRAGNSNIRLRVTQQTIGPFYYDAHCEIQATGEATYEVFDLRDITQSELNTLTTLPRGTRAVVNGGAVWTPKYWNGTAWTTNGGDGGGVEEAPADGTPYVRQDAAWVTEAAGLGFTSPAGNFMWKSDATTGDPGTGRIGTDTGTPGTAAVLYVDDHSKNATDVSGFLEMVKAGDIIMVWGRFNTANWARYVATGPAVFDTSWYEIPVTADEASGTDPGDWADVMVSFTSGQSTSSALGETTSTGSNITLSGSTAALVTIDNDSANTVTLVTQAVDATLEIRRPYLIRAIGDGTTTFSASGLASILMEDGKAAEIAAAHAPVTAMLVDASTWWLFGALADA